MTLEKESVIFLTVIPVTASARTPLDNDVHLQTISLWV